MHPRMEILKQIDDIKDFKCSPCNIRRKDNYCNEVCEHGKALQLLGDQLTELTNQKRANKQKSQWADLKPMFEKKPKEKIIIKPVDQKPNQPINTDKPKRSVQIMELSKETFLKLSGEGKTNKEIMQMYGMNNANFYKLKNDWGLVNSKFSRTKTSQSVEGKPEINNEVVELEKKLTEKDFALNAAIGASEKLIEENEQLVKEIEELKAQLEAANCKPDPVTPFYYELEETNNALRKCLKLVL